MRLKYMFVLVCNVNSKILQFMQRNNRFISVEHRIWIVRNLNDITLPLNNHMFAIFYILWIKLKIYKEELHTYW